MKKHLKITLILVALVVVYLLLNKNGSESYLFDFECCEKAGGAILESYPRQCQIGEQTFINEKEVEEIKGVQERENSDEFSGDVPEIIGMDVAEAENFATQNNRLFRIVEEDGEFYAVTLDYRPGRINAVVEKGKITSYTVE